MSIIVENENKINGNFENYEPSLDDLSPEEMETLEGLESPDESYPYLETPNIIFHLLTQKRLERYVDLFKPSFLENTKTARLWQLVQEFKEEFGRLPDEKEHKNELLKWLSKEGADAEKKFDYLTEFGLVWNNALGLDKIDYVEKELKNYISSILFKRSLVKAFEKHDFSDKVEAVRIGLEEAISYVDIQKENNFTQLISVDEFNDMDLKVEYIVEDCLAKGQPCVIGGKAKVLKTGIAVDLATSIASGTDFMHRWKTKKCRVAFWSGESGSATIRETCRRVVASKGIPFDSEHVDLLFCPYLPKFADANTYNLMKKVILEKKIEVCIIDPIYLSLLDRGSAGQAGNVFSMGVALEPISTLGQETDCTMIVCHHFNKNKKNDEMCNLEDLSQSGVAEWARQWFLIERRLPYQSDGVHDLSMRIGGSSGHGTFNDIVIREGLLNPKTQDGRFWEIEWLSREQAGAAKIQHFHDKAVFKKENFDVNRKQRVLSLLPNTKNGISKAYPSLTTKQRDDLLDLLIQEGLAKEGEVTSSNGRKYNGYIPTHPTEGVVEGG